MRKRENKRNVMEIEKGHENEEGENVGKGEGVRKSMLRRRSK
jgi:hypothetical protein